MNMYMYLHAQGYEPQLDVAVHARPRLAGNTSSHDPLGTPHSVQVDIALYVDVCVYIEIMV